MNVWWLKAVLCVALAYAVGCAAVAITHPFLIESKFLVPIETYLFVFVLCLGLAFPGYLFLRGALALKGVNYWVLFTIAGGLNGVGSEIGWMGEGGIVTATMGALGLVGGLAVWAVERATLGAPFTFWGESELDG